MSGPCQDVGSTLDRTPGNRVEHHDLWAGGSCICTDVNPTRHLSHSFEVPANGVVRLRDLVIVSRTTRGRSTTS